MQENLEVTNTLAITVGIIIIFIIIGLIAYIIHLSKRVKSLQTPKYGFLGKTIYPILVVVLLTGTLLFINYQEPEDVINTEAKKNVEFDIKLNDIKADGGSTHVFIALDVIIENTKWNIGDEAVDIYWDIMGPTSASRFEIGTTEEHRSGFDIYLENGTYILKAKIIYGAEEYEYSEEFIVE